VAGAVAAVAELAAAPEAASDPAPAGSPNRSRARHVLSAARLDGSRARPSGRQAHPDASAALIAGRIRRVTETPSRTLPPVAREICGHPRATRAIPTAAGGGVGGEDAARDRTVPRRVAARRVAGRRQADTPRAPEFAGIEWTSGALA
jgi:hypothetical protein